MLVSAPAPWMPGPLDARPPGCPAPWMPGPLDAPSRGATRVPGSAPGSPDSPHHRPEARELTPRPSRPGDQGKPRTAPPRTAPPRTAPPRTAPPRTASPRGAGDRTARAPPAGPAPPAPPANGRPGRAPWPRPEPRPRPRRGTRRPGKVCAQTAGRAPRSAGRGGPGGRRCAAPGQRLRPRGPHAAPREPAAAPATAASPDSRPRARNRGGGRPSRAGGSVPPARGRAPRAVIRPGAPPGSEHPRRDDTPEPASQAHPPALPAPRSLKAAHPDPSSRPWAAAGDPALSGERGSGSPSRGARRRTGLEACPAHLRLDSGHLRGPHRPSLALPGRHHHVRARGQRLLPSQAPQQPGDHPGGDVHLRRGGQPGGHRGAVQVAQGAEGDHLLHAGVRAGRHRPAGHAAGEPGDHRHVRAGRVAGRRGAVRVQHLHPALLRPVGPQHHLRHEHRALPGHQPRVLLQPLRGPAAGRPHAARRLRVQRALLRAARHGPGQLAPAVPGHLVLHRLDHQRDGARRLLLHVRGLQLLPHPRHRALQRAGVRRAAPHAPPVRAPHLAGRRAAPRGGRLRLRLLLLLGLRRPPGVPGRRLARPAAPPRRPPPPQLPPHRGRRDPDGHPAHRHLAGGAHLLHPARGASVHQPVVSADLSARGQQKPRPAGHPHRLCEPHPGPLDLHPPAEDSAQQSHGEDQMPLLPHRRVRQGHLGAALLRQQTDILRPVRPLALLPVPGAEGDQQHVPDSPVHARPRRHGPGGQEPAAGGARHEPAPSRHHLPEDFADIRDLGLLAGPGLRERLTGGRGWGRCWACPQGQLPAGHIPQ